MKPFTHVKFTMLVVLLAPLSALAGTLVSIGLHLILKRPMIWLSDTLNHADTGYQLLDIATALLGALIVSMGGFGLLAAAFLLPVMVCIVWLLHMRTRWRLRDTGLLFKLQPR